MKLYKFAIAAVAAISLGMTSCSDKGYWDEYTPETVNYTFLTQSKSYSFEESIPEYVTIDITRSTTSGVSKVPVKIESTPEGMGFPETVEVEFEAGKALSQLKLDVPSTLACGVTVEVKLTIDGDVNNVNIKTFTLSLYREYTFSLLGEGMISSPDALEYEWPVEVYVANENPRYFKIPEAYYVLGGTDPMFISVSSDYTVSTFKTFWAGTLSGYNLQLALTAYGSIDGNEITFKTAYRAYEGNSYAGPFGTFEEIVTMPDGWKK